MFHLAFPKVPGLAIPGKLHDMAGEGLNAQLAQMAPLMKGIIDRLKPVVDQPIIRFPYNLPAAQSQVIAANTAGQRLPDSFFSHSLEWPFEVHGMKFSQDPQHSFRDWRVLVKDQTFNQDLMKTDAMVATLVETTRACGSSPSRGWSGPRAAVSLSP